MIDTGSNGRSWLRAAGIVVARGDGDRHACTQLRGRVALSQTALACLRGSLTAPTASAARGLAVPCCLRDVLVRDLRPPFPATRHHGIGARWSALAGNPRALLPGCRMGDRGPRCQSKAHSGIVCPASLIWALPLGTGQICFLCGFQAVRCCLNRAMRRPSRLAHSRFHTA